MNRMEGCRIIYADPPVTLIAPLKDPKARERVKAWKSAPKQAKNGLWVYASPPVLPLYNKKRALNEINQKRLAKYYASLCRAHGFDSSPDDLTVWCYSPSSADIIAPLAKELGIAPAKLWKQTVYDCVDRHSAYPGLIDPEVVDSMEEDLAGSAGCVFATAKGLYDRLKVFNDNTHLIPNGANYELFSKAQTMGRTSFAGPVFGFVGMLQECIDYRALESVAKAYPQGKLVFIGRRLPGVDLSTLEALPNVVFKGLLPQEKLPEEIAEFDVCLNAFADNDLSKDVSPLKFYEYLATGKPVVSTPVPVQVRDYADCIYIAENSADFARKCAEALAEPSDSGKREKRIESARACSWDERVGVMKKILDWD